MTVFKYRKRSTLFSLGSKLDFKPILSRGKTAFKGTRRDKPANKNKQQMEKKEKNHGMDVAIKEFGRSNNF